MLWLCSGFCAVCWGPSRLLSRNITVVIVDFESIVHPGRRCGNREVSPQSLWVGQPPQGEVLGTSHMYSRHVRQEKKMCWCLYRLDFSPTCSRTMKWKRSTMRRNFPLRRGPRHTMQSRWAWAEMQCSTVRWSAVHRRLDESQCKISSGVQGKNAQWGKGGGKEGNRGVGRIHPSLSGHAPQQAKAEDLWTGCRITQDLDAMQSQQQGYEDKLVDVLHWQRSSELAAFF